MTPEENYEKESKAMNINLPPGTRLIVKSADEQTYKLATMVGPMPVSKAMNAMPVVKLDDGKEVVHFGVVRKYDERVAKALDKLTGEEQWNVMAKNYIIGG